MCFPSQQLELLQLPGLHGSIQLSRDGLAVQLPAQSAACGDDAVPVADDHRSGTGAVEGLAQIGGGCRLLPGGRIFFKDHASADLGENFHWLSLPDLEGAANLLGDDHPSQIVPLCQVGAKKFNGFFKKLVVTRVLSLLKCAAMRLRWFDRLCNFRDKFDQFSLYHTMSESNPGSDIAVGVEFNIVEFPNDLNALCIIDQDLLDSIIQMHSQLFIRKT